MSFVEALYGILAYMSVKLVLTKGLRLKIAIQDASQVYIKKLQKLYKVNVLLLAK